MYELELKLIAIENNPGVIPVDINLKEIIDIFDAPYSSDISFHNKLDQYERAASTMNLLICIVRGKKYDEWKKNNPSANFFQTFNISPRQGNRYIQLFQIVKKYPRLLICGFSFAEIVLREKEIEEKAASNREFETLLKGILINLLLQILCHILFNYYLR